MKTTCLFVALGGFAMAQEPAPAPAPLIRVQGGVAAVPGVPHVGGVTGVPADLAIPSMEEARELIEPLRWTFERAQGRFHEVVRPGPAGFVGLNATLLPRELSAHLSLPEDTGLLVEVVAKDSPAEKGGLQANDVLAKFDDQILIDPHQFSVLVANKKEGDTVKITYIRKGETHEASIVIGMREGGAPAFGKTDADFLFKHTDGAPLRTFVRRFKVPGGEGQVKIEGSVSEDVEIVPAPRVDPAGPPDEDVKKQLEEIRAMLEALQQKVK